MIQLYNAWEVQDPGDYSVGLQPIDDIDIEILTIIEGYAIPEYNGWVWCEDDELDDLNDFIEGYFPIRACIEKARFDIYMTI